MKIGFDISQTEPSKAGCGFYAANMLEALADIDKANQYLLYTNFGDFYWGDPNSVLNIEQHNFKSFLPHANKQEAQQFWSLQDAQKESQLGDVEIIHNNNFFCAPEKLPNIKTVYTLYDLSFIHYPEFTTEENRLGCFRCVFNASCFADHIVAISEYTKQDFLKIFPYYPTDKISIIYPGNRYESEVEIRGEQAIKNIVPGKFWLNVGTIEPRKNYQGLLKAYAEFKKAQPDAFPLVFAGKKGWMYEGFDHLVEELNLSNDVIVLGYVSDEQMQWLYQNCFAFLYPSFFEGFGMPVLEAMHLGAPVITSNVSSIPEITGNAAVLVEPNDYMAIAKAMMTLSNNKDYRLGLIEKAKNRSQLFSWKQSAQKLLKVYESLMSKS